MTWRPGKFATSHLGGQHAWAAVLTSGGKLHFAKARETDGALRVVHEAAVDTAAEVRLQVDPREHRIITALASEDVLCRALRLPTTTESELKQMLDLQIDQLTPLPLDEVVYDFEPLEQADGNTLVLVAIARKSVVNEHVAPLEEAGLPPERVSVDALAIFQALHRQGITPQDDRLNLLVWLRETVMHLIVCSRGWPLVVRSVMRGEAAAWDAETLAAELHRTQLSAQTEWPGREAGKVVMVIADPALEPVARGMSADWAGETELLANGAVPSPASALCPTSPGERRFNLLPNEWRQRRRTQQRRRLLIRCAIALGIIYLLLLAGLLAANLIRGAQKRSLQAEAKRLDPDYRAARQLQGTLVALQKQLDTKYSALDTLREVSLLMPPNLKLNAFVFRRDDSVTLKGQADSAQAVYDFIGRLEQCDLFSKVDTRGVPTTAGLTKFELVATLKSAAGKTVGAR